MRISARNKIAGTITRIHRDESIANVVVDVGGERLVASITTEAVRDFRLAEGDPVIAVIKASDVMIATAYGVVIESRCARLYPFSLRTRPIEGARESAPPRPTAKSPARGDLQPARAEATALWRDR
jgi:molybdate transport system regulatory protein